jgi:hypothetical protein
MLTTCRLFDGLRTSVRRPCARFVHGRFARNSSSSAKSSLNGQEQQEQSGIDSSEEPRPLVLWLGGADDSNNVPHSLGAAADRMREVAVPLLLPPIVFSSSTTPSAAVASIQDVVDIVNSHYDHDARQQFVGGMGESDPGVWFAAQSRTSQLDAMLYSDLVVEAIARVKDERHGVPFAMCTTGLFFPSTSLSDLAECVDCLHVSLHASNPKEYQQLSSRRRRGHSAPCAASSPTRWNKACPWRPGSNLKWPVQVATWRCRSVRGTCTLPDRLCGMLGWPPRQQPWLCGFFSMCGSMRFAVCILLKSTDCKMVLTFVTL